MSSREPDLAHVDVLNYTQQVDMGNVNINDTIIVISLAFKNLSQVFAGRAKDNFVCKNTFIISRHKSNICESLVIHKLSESFCGISFKCVWL